MFIPLFQFQYDCDTVLKTIKYNIFGDERFD